jgi:hypothetical protein
VREGAPHGQDSNFQTWVETVKYMATGPTGLGPKNDCAGERQQQL